jgi:hypothetical protein
MDREKYLKVLKKYATTLSFVAEEYLTEEVVLAIAPSNPYGTLHNLPDNLRTEEFSLKMLHAGCSLNTIPIQSIDLCCEAVRIRTHNIRHVPAVIREDVARRCGYELSSSYVRRY